MSFVLTAHRGSPDVAPENTVEAFRAAMAAGADELELDLQVSADGELVVFHDQTLDRVTDGRGPLADRTLAELRELLVHGPASAPPGRIATFAEVLAEVGSFPLQVELKAPKAAAALAALLRQRPELEQQFSVNSGNPEYLTDLHQRHPSAPLAFSAESASIELVELGASLHARAVYLRLRDLDATIVAHARAVGLRITGWLADTEAEIHRAFDLGLDGITTDYVSVVRPLIDRRLHTP